MSIDITTNEAPGALGPGYDLSPDGLSFAKPALLALRYGNGVVPAQGIGGVAVVVLTGAGWAGLTGGHVDTSSRSLLIRLQSTSPADAPAAARAALALRAPTRLGANQAIVVRVPEWLPTKGKLPLVVDVRTTPSSAGSEFKYEYVGAAIGIVTAKWSKPNLGSLDALNRPQVNYTAPDTISSVYLPVTSSVTVTRNGALIGNAKFSFNVIRRNFKLTASYTMDIPCGGSNDVSLKSFDEAHPLTAAPLHVENNFRFSDDLTFHPDLPIPGNLVGCSIETCRAALGCVITAITGVPFRMELNNLSGQFQGIHGFFVRGEMFQKHAFPGYEETCRIPYTGGSESTDLLLPIVGSWALSSKTEHFDTPGTGGIVVRFEWSSINADIP
jgi:hypothetical protein